MAVITIEREVCSVVQEKRYACDYCTEVSTTDKLPSGWGLLTLYHKADKGNKTKVVCSNCMNKLKL